ncbi:hypothetical protein A2U01_0068018, partial [Trifolium medium]|nr:hypothetical protein [Trifolium medium]
MEITGQRDSHDPTAEWTTRSFLVTPRGVSVMSTRRSVFPPGRMSRRRPIISSWRKARWSPVFPFTGISARTWLISRCQRSFLVA